MSKFLKLLLILVISPFILAGIGYFVLPSEIVAYISNGKNVYIGSYMIFTFAIIDLIISVFGITYLRRCKKKFPDENYPNGVKIIAYINLLLSVMLNYFTYWALKSMLFNANIDLPFYITRIVFSIVAVLIALYALYISRANIESEFAIRNKYSLMNEIVFKYANRFSAIVFLAGSIFMLIMSWTMQSKNQLYIIMIFIIIICIFSSQYISKSVALNYKKMFRKKK